jgi:hypothetical protein
LTWAETDLEDERGLLNGGEFSILKGALKVRGSPKLSFFMFLVDNFSLSNSMANKSPERNNLGIQDDVEFVAETPDRNVDIKRKCVALNHQAIDVMKADIVRRQTQEEEFRQHLVDLDKDRRNLLRRAVDVLDVEITDNVKLMKDDVVLRQVKF